MLLAALFSRLRTPALGEVLRRADPVPLWIVVVGTFGTYGVRAWRLGFLLAPLLRVPFRRLLAATYLGFMAGLVVPRAGEVLRPWIVTRGHAVPTSAAFAAIVLERVFDVTTILVLFGLGLLGSGVRLHLDRGWREHLVMGSLLAGAAALCVLLLLVALEARPQATQRLVTTLLRPLPAPVKTTIVGAIASFGSGLAVLRASPVHLAVIAGQSLLVWLFVAVGVQASNRAFGIALPFSAALVVLGFILVGVSIPTPAAVGGFHTAYVLALSMVYRVEPERAAAAALACHGLTALAVVVVGLALLPGEGLTFRQLTTRPPSAD